MYNPEQTRLYYADADQAAQFEALRFHGAYGRHLLQHDEAFFTRHPQVEYGACQQVLEVGCGTGRLTLPMTQRLEPGATLLAVDRSPEMLAQLQRKWTTPPANLTLQACAVEALTLPLQGFDLVYSSRVLMHLEDWEAGLLRLAGLSRRYVICDFPVRGSLAWLGKSLLDATLNRGRREDKYRFLPLRRVLAVLDGAGLQVVALHRLQVLPIPLHLRLNRVRLSLGLEAGLGWLGLRRGLGSPVYLVAERKTGFLLHPAPKGLA